MAGYWDACELITQTPGAHGIHDSASDTKRRVMCFVQSVSRSEYYNANSVGLQPEYVLKLSDRAEYQDELMLTFNSKKWNVIRHYMTDDGGIELTIQRSDGR